MSYSSWYPAAVEGLDEVPNAHHVTGVAITLDLLHNSFIQSDLDKYYNVLFRQALVMYRTARFFPCEVPEGSGTDLSPSGLRENWSHFQF